VETISFCGESRAIHLRQIKEYRKVWDQYFKFAFVRNPWSWVVSYYFDRLYRKSRGKKIDVVIPDSFEEFVLMKGWYENKHQFVGCYDRIYHQNKLLVDFVGKVENIELDFKHVCNNIGVIAELGWRNKSNHDQYRTYYNKKTRSLVEIAFQKDIDVFEYSF